MPSLTQKTEFRRAIRKKNAGKKRKSALNLHGTTPVFPIHTEESDKNAPNEAKPQNG